MLPVMLSARALNRATLARQLLLERAPLDVERTVAHLVGLRAQVPLDPYTGLWSRVAGFDPNELGRALVDRTVVRLAVMRSTIHLLTADDALLLRPLVQPVLDAELARHREFAPALAGLELGPVLDHARRLLAERPRTGAELRAALAERFPGRDPAALAHACRCKLTLVQVPPRGVWGETSQVTLTTAEAWLGRPLVRRPSLDDVVLRYLAAFGPASAADVAAWCGLAGMRTVVERLRSRLVAFRDDRGRELVDLEDAPRPDPETPAPTRFLPEYDNVLLSHADRSRFGHDRGWLAGGRGRGTVLHDGVVAGRWRLERDRNGSATLVVRPTTRLAKRAMGSVEAEGRRLLRFLAPDADPADLRLERRDAATRD
jgi:hypothetical protein